MSKVDLEQKFDEVWNDSLKNLTPQVIGNEPAHPALGFPAKTRVVSVVFKDGAGWDLALAYHHYSPGDQVIGNRLWNPTGLRVETEWWFI